MFRSTDGRTVAAKNHTIEVTFCVTKARNDSFIDAFSSWNVTEGKFIHSFTHSRIRLACACGICGSHIEHHMIHISVSIKQSVFALRRLLFRHEFHSKPV